ncbi:MAG: hypothetical protein CMH55_01845 [Myxococcales bacterium]|nr:hypothetical protein [Myxococcales bacterium]
MFSDVIYARPLVTGCIFCSLLIGQVRPAVATSGDRPRKETAAVTKVTQTDPDRVAVTDFLKTARAAAEAQNKRTPDSGYGVDRRTFYLAEAWCVQRVSLPRNMVLERCKVLDVSDGRVAVLVVTSNCEVEHCDADYWIFSDRRGLRRSPINLDFELVVSPDHQFMYVGEVQSGPEGPKAHLMRIELKTMSLRRVANCAAPVLSPSKRSIGCRDASGNVHRFPLPDGPLTLVHTIDLGKKRIYSDAHSGVTLPAVRFIADNRIRIVTLTQGGDEEDIEEANWVESPRPPPK